MKLKILFCLFLFGLIFTSSSLSQPNSVYNPFSSKAPIPKEFLATSTEKYEANIKNIDRELSRDLRKAQDKFYLENSFIVDGLLKSGRVLFNDKAGIYINKIADQILKDNPQLRSQVRFYIVKSPIPNAFTSQQGTILINMGLLARLQTEAQLAFILCHEIAHYQKKHILNRYLEFQSIDLEKGDYQGLKEYDKLLLKSYYSQANETEADLLGFELFKQSGYSTSTIPGTFDILEDAGLALLSSKGNFSPLLSSHYQKEDLDKILPSDKKNTQITLVDVNKINRRNNYTGPKKEESPSSHPAPMIRKGEIEAKIEEWQNAESGETFIISAEEFAGIRENAKFAVIDFYLAGGYFFDALHQTLVLMREYPDDFFLRKSLAHSLYSIAKYKSHYQDFDILFEYSKNPNDRRLLEAFGVKEYHHFRIMAISQVWDFMNQFQDYAVTGKPMLYDLLFDLHNDSWGKEGGEKDPLTLKVIQALNQTEEFREIFTSAEQEKKEYDDFKNYLNTSQGSQGYEKYLKKQRKGGFRLGIDKVVVFDPFYYRLDLQTTSKEYVKLIESEEQLANMHEEINYSSGLLSLETDILDSKILKDESNFQIFEDYSQITEWHDQWNRDADFRFVPSNYDKILEISERYGTPYFMQIGIISGKFPKNLDDISITLMFTVFPPTWPVAIFRIVSPKERGVVIATVFDVQNNRRIMYQRTRLKRKITNGSLTRRIYSKMRQVKSK